MSFLRMWNLTKVSLQLCMHFLQNGFLNNTEKWNLQKSACDNWIKIELWLVFLAEFRANLSIFHFLPSEFYLGASKGLKKL